MSTEVQAGSNNAGGTHGTFGQDLGAANTIILIVGGFNNTGAAMSSSAPELNGAEHPEAVLLYAEQSLLNSGSVYTAAWQLTAAGGESTYSLTYSGGTCIGIFYFEAGIGSGAEPDPHAAPNPSTATNPNSEPVDSGPTGELSASSEFCVASGILYAVGLKPPNQTYWTSFSMQSSFFWAGWAILNEGQQPEWTQASTTGGTAPWASGVVALTTPPAPPASSAAASWPFDAITDFVLEDCQ